MKKFLGFLCAVMMVFGMVAVGSATVLTFDDIGLGSEPIYDGYGGLNWDEMWYLNATQPEYSNSGYENGTVSGDYVAYNAWANVATVEDGLFDFNGAYFTGAWRDGLNIRLRGFSGGSQQYETTIVVDHTGPTWATADFLGIDRLEFYSFGGTQVDNLFGSGAHFAMDNFTFNETAPVPEPATILLMGTGLLGMMGYGRKRLNKKA
ncbi:MAG: hypothetical protein AVO38_05335 [delta proteobacterium ML8_D]|jgi:hypothetical protein|nr:MAG: hypothetical protein AVO38_05335 [delta proteobacterium ML8_D]